MVFIGQRMDTLVIAAVRNAATAAPFAAAIRLAGGVQSLTFPFVTLLMPMASDLHARGRHDEVIRRFSIATRIAFQLTFPTAVAFSLFATDITDVWLGPDAPDVTAAIIAVLMAVQILTMSAFPAEKVLVGIGRVKVVAMLAVIEGFSNIAISIVLVSAYGAIGAALGTLFTSGVLAPIKFPLACRATGCPTPQFLRNAIVPARSARCPPFGYGRRLGPATFRGVEADRRPRAWSGCRGHGCGTADRSAADTRHATNDEDKLPVTGTP